MCQHFKAIFPPHKNLGVEDFLEVVKFLIARTWLVEQLGGDSPAKQHAKTFGGGGFGAGGGKTQEAGPGGAAGVRLPQISMFQDHVKFPEWKKGDSDLVGV